MMVNIIRPLKNWPLIEPQHKSWLTNDVLSFFIKHSVNLSKDVSWRKELLMLKNQDIKSYQCVSKFNVQSKIM